MPRLRQFAYATLALTILAAGLAYFASAFHTKVSRTPTQKLAIAGSVVVAALTDTATTAPIPGTVSPTDETIIGARLLAAVIRIHVRAGDTVEKGQVLLEFDDSSLDSVREQRAQASASARAAFEEATRNRDRAASLFDSGALSRADHDRAMTNHRIAAAELQRAEQAVAEAQTQLNYATVVAPISGTIVERYIEPGDTATPGQPLLKLFNPGRLRVEAILRESLIAHVKPGDELAAHIDALDLSVTSIVEEIVPSADPGSRTFRIKALLPPLSNLYPGMFARLEIPLGTEPRMLLPAAAIHRSGQMAFVYVNAAGEVDRRVVRLGNESAGLVEVVSGVAPGAEVYVE